MTQILGQDIGETRRSGPVREAGLHGGLVDSLGIETCLLRFPQDRAHYDRLWRYGQCWR